MSNTPTALARTKSERAVEVVLREYDSDSMPTSKNLRLPQLLEDNTKATCFLSIGSSDRWWVFNSGRNVLSRNRENYFDRLHRQARERSCRNSRSRTRSRARCSCAPGSHYAVSALRSSFMTLGLEGCCLRVGCFWRRCCCFGRGGGGGWLVNTMDSVLECCVLWFQLCSLLLIVLPMSPK